MDISSYLIELLRLHECVIVPNFGGFVSNYHPARVDFIHNNFNPPRKDIVFNSKLSKNDGLLVNYISESEGIGYFESRQYVSEFVDELWSRLENGEEVNLKGIGTFHFDKYSKLIFEPDVTENLLVDVYGMESFNFKQLKSEGYTRPVSRFSDKDAVRVMFNSRRVKQLLVGVPIILALTLIPLSKNFEKHNLFVNKQANNTATLSLIDSTSPSAASEDTGSFDTASYTENKPVAAAIDSPAEEKVNEIIKEPQIFETSDGTSYHLVGGSFKDRINAEKYHVEMTKKGYRTKVFTLPNGYTRVTINSFYSRKDALEALNYIRENNPNSKIWLYHN
jgi:nucleoid DNA-binding protein